MDTYFKAWPVVLTYHLMSVSSTWFSGHILQRTVPVPMLHTNLLQCLTICRMIITPPVALFHQTEDINGQICPMSCLIILAMLRYSTSDLYMTPYSTIFSHWPAVVVIGCVGVVLFLLTVTSLFSSLLWTDDILIMHGPGVAGDIALLFGI